MRPTEQDLERRVYDSALAVRALADVLWQRTGHTPADWEPRTEPFIGWTTRCEQCGENCVLQFLLPRLPLAVGLAINMLPSECGDRVYVPAHDEIDFEVFA